MYRINRAHEAMRFLNKLFQDKEFFHKKFYIWLAENGCSLSRTTLINITEEQEGQYFGKLICGDFLVYEFDFDIDWIKQSIIFEISDQFHPKREIYKKSKPWHEYVTSYEYHKMKSRI